ncbi:hypothetical protein GCM10009678_62640 [Actinomadura kijaniata]|uniref:Rne/Rng family ribonuclease n=1 Tax=Actinomadura kijaniata TaxID=46161 RepID=UPI002FEC83B6
MLENDADSAAAEGTDTSNTPTSSGAAAGTASTGVTRVTRTRKRAASRPAGPPPDVEDTPAVIAVPVEEKDRPAAPAEEPPAKKVTRTRKTTARSRKPAGEPEPVEDKPADKPVEAEAATEQPAEKPARRTRKRAAAPAAEKAAEEAPEERDAAPAVPPAPAVPAATPAPVADEEEGDEDEEAAPGVPSVTFQPPMVVFQPPQPTATPPARSRKDEVKEDEEEGPEDEAELADDAEDDESDDRPSRRRRRRGGRGRGRTGKEGGEDEAAEEPQAAEEPEPAEPAEAPAEEAEDADGGTSRRRRPRRRRTGAADAEPAVTPDDPPNTVVHVRESRAVEDEVQAVRGSTRLEAKKQRRREGREQGRRRPPVITEAEFLARREAVERVMVVRQEGERTQIAVLEDDVLVEHYVNRATQQSYVGNVYLGKVQNVLPSMEAAFVDIGKGRNAVLYAGEVNWDVAGLEGQPRRIESALKSGQSVLVQVTKDPLGHKGARLTSQVSLPGRYLVYVPDGSMTGISRKLPDKERSRLKQILKKIMPENAGVIVRTAAEGATEEELARDVSRLAAQWDNIRSKVKSASAPSLLYGEPDLTIRVVRDIFNEDFTKLVVQGGEAWDTVSEYVEYVAPHLADRVEKWTGDGDVLGGFRIDEQIAKALDRKVWLPSGGSLVIDRTEAMTVIDVNTGKFTGQGGNLEETVTRNNLEAAEEIVRQLRLRDIGGIIVVDFIDMVLESNRDLVLRRLVECLSRDRTKHQVAEVTSLGLVQMTRKRVGQGLLEAFSETCECCNGRGIHVQLTPVEPKADKPGQGKDGGRRRKRKGEVEKAVEEKLAQQEKGREGARAEEAPAEEPKVEEAPAPEAAEAKPESKPKAKRATRARKAKAVLADEEGAEAVVEAADAAAEAADAAPGTLEADEPVPADLNGEAAEEAATAGNGRRRRTRRTVKKAETEAPADVAAE